MKSTKELIDILSLKEIEQNSFKGISTDIGSPIVFGGQVMAQAVHAGYNTIKNGRILHS